ncbi:MAG: SPOR domain-containing protein [bacterium]|nr:MAG: SPOR domain-containing protein [bacterium]
MNRVFTHLGLLTLLVLITVCSSSRSLINEAESSKDDENHTGIVNEFFDPLILNEEDLKVKKTISIEPKSEQMDETLTQPKPDDQKPEIVSGYRVQICAVSDEARARQIQRDAILKFIDEEVYLIYDSPYYKVRVGNCLTRYEADRLQQLAVEKGFDDAWVVRTKIKLKNSSDKLENEPLN